MQSLNLILIILLYEISFISTFSPYIIRDGKNSYSSSFSSPTSGIPHTSAGWLSIHNHLGNGYGNSGLISSYNSNIIRGVGRKTSLNSFLGADSGILGVGGERREGKGMMEGNTEERLERSDIRIPVYLSSLRSFASLGRRCAPSTLIGLLDTLLALLLTPLIPPVPPQPPSSW